ncbi:MAG TPA: DUF711 family protein [Bellilinea sp.]
MNIRSITTFYDPELTGLTQPLDNLALFAHSAKTALVRKGYPVQSLRLATSPFPGWAKSLVSDDLAALGLKFQDHACQHGFNYLSLGPTDPTHPDGYIAIPAILAAADSVFATGLMTLPGGRVSLPAVRACAQVIAQAAQISPDGFTNLRFAALGNVPPGSPFLPSAYHTAGDPPAVALAVESADLALAVFSQANSLESARRELLLQLEEHAILLQSALGEPCERFGVQFLGLDYSLAPYPSDTCSSGAALETLGLTRLGLSGTLAAAAFLADTLDRGNWPRSGFNGLMLPVLEDSTLAARAAEGSLTVRDLMMVSAVCGTGLDTIPLPGDATADQLAAILLDVAVLSQRLDKPLTARLMPIPGKNAGDETNFEFEFFANSRVMALYAEPLTRLFAGDEVIDFQPRRSNRKVG